MNTPQPNPEFDQYAANYNQALAQGISVSGENQDFFAQGRVEWLAQCLGQISVTPRAVMDYGCGTGQAASFILEYLKAENVLGVDVSEGLLAVAQRDHGSAKTRFLPLQSYTPSAQMDLVFCNGVFHHIPLAERAAAANYVFRSLRPGGIFALWENNPWNPGTRYVMSRIPFDRDAITLSPPTARKLVHSVGFEILSTNFLFLFPRALSWLRWIEPLVSNLPAGAQYQVLARKPL
jgi:trans-aconitate methyltransferase